MLIIVMEKKDYNMIGYSEDEKLGIFFISQRYMRKSGLNPKILLPKARKRLWLFGQNVYLILDTTTRQM